MESYTVQYSAGMSGCTSSSRNGTIIDIVSTRRTFEITDLEEGSDIMGTVTAINRGGRSQTPFTTMTLATSKYYAAVSIDHSKML